MSSSGMGFPCSASPVRLRPYRPGRERAGTINPIPSRGYVLRSAGIPPSDAICRARRSLALSHSRGAAALAPAGGAELRDAAASGAGSSRNGAQMAEATAAAVAAVVPAVVQPWWYLVIVVVAAVVKVLMVVGIVAAVNIVTSVICSSLLCPSPLIYHDLPPLWITGVQVRSGFMVFPWRFFSALHVSFSPLPFFPALSRRLRRGGAAWRSRAAARPPIGA